MKTPHGFWLDDRPGREPSLVVADRANARLQYFTLDGKHIGFVNDVLFPAHFDIRGEVLLVPDLHGRSRFSIRTTSRSSIWATTRNVREKTRSFKFGGDPKQWLPGKFVHPHDACFDKAGNIFVVEWVPEGRITLLKRVTG